MRRLLLIGLVVMTAGCAFGQFGPWLDESDQPLEGSQVLQYRGFDECGHQEVLFFFFFGDLYAQDDDGVLGQLTNSAGEPLEYQLLDGVPEGAEATGIHLGTKEIYLNPDIREDYIYVYNSDDNRTEQWPRAEIDCDRPGTPG